MNIRMKALLAAMAVTMAVSTVAVAQPAMPPPVAEEGPPPAMPGPNGWVLEPGHWHWNGFRYVWIHRHWIHAGPGFAHFVPGHWAPTGAGPRWVPAHWVP
jgi:hypothetical protein